jgi:6-phosphofructokinase 1
MRNIGLLTSGGDAPGLNAVLYGAAAMAQARGARAWIIPNGYAGLYNLERLTELVALDADRRDALDCTTAGSSAGHSRIKIAAIPDANRYQRIIAGLQRFSIDGLVIAGGDDTGSVVVDLADRGIPVVHAPKTIDMDLQTYSVGGDTAANRIARIVDDLKSTGRSHNRVMITEAFGRYAGHVALRGGIAADADCILLPEVPVDFDIVHEHLKRRLLGRLRAAGGFAATYTVVVAEGMTTAGGDTVTDDSVPVDAFGHRKLAGAGRYVRDQIQSRLDGDAEIRQAMRELGMYVPELHEAPEAREVVPAHLVRSGATSAFDVGFGKQIGAGAVLLLLDGVSGVTVSWVDGDFVSYLPTRAAIAQHNVDPAIISLYEEMGVCFGRRPQRYAPKFRELDAPEPRYL